MLKFVRLLVFFTFIINPLYSETQDGGGIDVQKGNEAYANNDYYSALVFYSRAMGSQDITDGIIWYKTAYAYETIKGKDSLLDSLYTISFFYLVKTNPDHKYTDILKTKINQSVRVNDRFVKKTRLELAGRMAEPEKKGDQFSLAAIKKGIQGWFLFFKDTATGKLERMQLPLRDFKSGGILSGIRSLFQNWEVLLLGLIILFFPTGILLPFIIGNYRSSRGKPKGLIEAYLLWFHWGGFGIHRFYLGQYGMGILLLLTFGGVGIGWLLEGFFLVRNYRRLTRSGSSSIHRSQMAGSRGKTRIQPERQVSRRKPAEDNFDDFNLLSSGEEL